MRGEAAENLVRKDFTPSEDVAIRRTLRSIEKAAAKERQGTRTDKHSGNLPESSKGDTRDKTAAYTNRRARTLTKLDSALSAFCIPWPVPT